MSQPTEGQDPPRDQSPWTRPWFIASAAVAVVLIALGIAYVALPSPSNGQTAAPAPPATGTATAQAGQSVCGLPAGDQRYPSVGLPTKWELLGRVAVPTDPKGIGPGKTDGPVRTCYQHSPTGALYAAANIFGSGLLPDGPRIITENLTAKTPLRERLLASPAPQASADPSHGAQIGGFKLASYTGAKATVVLGLKLSPAGYMSATYGLRWEDGDWKQVLEEVTYATGLEDLSSFVPWTGV